MLLPTTTVGRKLLMTVTGQFMIVYAIAHLLGNISLFFSGINEYAAWLREWPGVLILWGSRPLLLLSLVLHAWYGILLNLENQRAKPETYRVTHYRTASVAGRSMIWSGLLIFLFLIYHILHFTLNLIDPSMAAMRDAFGRHDVADMIVRGFENRAASFTYIASLGAMLLHLMHGIQSSFQTWGLNNDRSLPRIVYMGIAVSVILFLGYVAIPLSVLAGMMEHFGAFHGS